MDVLEGSNTKALTVSEEGGSVCQLLEGAVPGRVPVRVSVCLSEAAWP